MSIKVAVAVPHPPLIIPAVGKGEEEQIQPTIDAYRKAMKLVAAFEPETVVVASPHSAMYRDWFHLSPGAAARGGFSRFGAPGVKLQAYYDEPLVAALEAGAARLGLPAGTRGEKEPELDHGTLIPLWFLNEALPACKVVRLGLSGLSFLDHYAMGQVVATVAKETGRRVAFLASGDLSHRLKPDGPYGFAPEGPELDGQITRALAKADFGALLAIDPALAEKGAECGLRSLLIMAGALDGRAVDAKLLSYQDTFGVGYAVATFLPGAPDENRRYAERARQPQPQKAAVPKKAGDPYVKLARYSLEYYVEHGRCAPLPAGLPPEMRDRKAGVFVSLHKAGALRGCIGTIQPVTGSVAEEVLRNAVSAAAGDPRFAPVRPDELPELDVKVDVLGEPEPVDGPEALDPKKYGVIVSSGGGRGPRSGSLVSGTETPDHVRRGVLLPDLEGVDTVADQVDIARRKAGIPAGCPLKLERFEVVRHEDG